MGGWGNVAFMRASREAIRDALVALFAAEGRSLVAAPAPRTPPRYDPMQYGDGAACPLWGVALLPARDGFCMVQTAPLELLAERAKRRGPTRLAALCRALAKPGFALSLYDGTGLVLLEASAAGETSVSGLGEPSRDPSRWQGMRITRFEPRFTRVDAPREAREALESGDSERAFEQLAIAMLGEHAHLAHNELSVLHLVPHQPLHVEGGLALYFGRESEGERRDPLPVELSEETFAPAEPRDVLAPAHYGGWPERRRLRVRAGEGEAWITGTLLEAPDAERGGLFLDAIARWLGVPAPKPLVPPGLLAPVFCVVDPVDGALALRIGDRKPAELRLRVEADRGELVEVDPTQRERLLALLAPALRDGPGRGEGEPLVARWQRASDDPAYVAGAGFAGDDLVFAQWRGRDRATLHRLALESGEREEVVELEGLVSRLTVRGSVAFASVTRPMPGMPSAGIGSNDPTTIVAVDLATRSVRALAVDFDVASFGPVVASTDASMLALEERRLGAPGRARVVDAASGQTIAALELPGLAPVAWDDEGLALVSRDYQSFGPSRWLRWTPRGGLSEIEEEHRAPDGVRALGVEPDAIVVRGPEGETRVPMKHPQVTTILRGPVWIGQSCIALGGSRPKVLSLLDASMRPLAPPARELDPVASSADGRYVAAFVGQGRLFVGRAG